MKNDTVIADLYKGRGAELYHQLVTADASEIREIINRIRFDKPQVLELAAGSGRLSLPLLPFVARLVAVDNSRDLLKILAERLSNHSYKNRIVLEEQDIRSYDTSGFFDVVLLGTSSIALFSPKERKKIYQVAYQALTPEGKFLVSLRVAPAPSAQKRYFTAFPELQVSECLLEDGRMRSEITEVDVMTGNEIARYSVATYLLQREEFLAELSESGFRLGESFTINTRREQGERERVGSYELCELRKTSGR